MRETKWDALDLLAAKPMNFRWHRQSVRIKEVPVDISWTVFLVRRSVHFTTPFLPAVRTPRSWIGFRHVTPSWTEVQPGRCCSVWGSIKRNESSEDIDTSRSPKGITSYMYVSGSSGGDAATDAATFILSCCDGWEGAIWGGTPRGLLLSNLRITAHLPFNAAMHAPSNSTRRCTAWTA